MIEAILILMGLTLLLRTLMDSPLLTEATFDLFLVAGGFILAAYIVMGVLAFVR